MTFADIERWLASHGHGGRLIPDGQDSIRLFIEADGRRIFAAVDLFKTDDDGRVVVGLDCEAAIETVVLPFDAERSADG